MVGWMLAGENCKLVFLVGIYDRVGDCDKRLLGVIHDEGQRFRLRL